jgi:hypothetical protein
LQSIYLLNLILIKIKEKTQHGFFPFCVFRKKGMVINMENLTKPTQRKEFVKKLPCKITALGMFLFVLISIAAPVIQWAFKIAWVFIDHETKMEDFAGIGLAQFIFFLMIANALFAIFVLVRYYVGWRSKAGDIVITVLFVLSSLLGVMFQIMNYTCSVIARTAPLGYSLLQTVPWVAALLGVPFLLLVWGNLRIKKTQHQIFSAVVAVLFVATMLLSLIDPGKPKLLAGPVVFDTGMGEYAIVFATDKNTQGFVRYTYNKQEKECYSADTIVRRIGKIHAVRVPREELEDNSYTLFVREVRYGLVAHVGKSNYGKTLQLGNPVQFKGSRNIKNPKILSISDWHEQMPTMKRAVEAFGVTPDLVLLMGDYCNYYAGEEDVITTIIGGAHDATKGETPTIFVRGNHEVRGNYMELQNIDRLLVLDRLYYEVERGDYIFTVLDSAESSEWEKDAWEHVEQYSASAYFTEQIEWLEQLRPASDGQYRIVLTHAPYFVTDVAGISGQPGYADMPEANKALNVSLAQRYQAAMRKLGTHLSVSGDTHTYKVSTPEWSNGTLTQIEDGGTGGIQGTGKKLGPLTIIPSVPEYTATLLTFYDTEILVQGKCASGPSDKFGGVRDMETFTIPKMPQAVP